MKRLAERVADWLAARGVEQVFAVTGGGAMFLNHALGSHPGLRCTFMHHEQACAMAAEGYARIAGKPAVVNLTTGPGSINALNGVFGAYTDSIPMIVISGQVKRETCLAFNDLPGLRQLGDQEGPTIELARSVTKYARLIREPGDLAEALPEAWAAATSGRPGPVWIDIPMDIQGATDDIPAAPAPAPACASIAGPPLGPDCEEIASRLAKAHRPVILGGTGVRLSGAVEKLLALAESTGIPVATAWTHDLIASDHPLFAGRPGTIGTRAGNFCLQAADLVIVIGSRLNIRQTSYNWTSFAREAWIAMVDIDPAELGKPMVRPHLAITSDAGRFIDALGQALESHRLPDFSPWARWCRATGERYAVAREHRQEAGCALNPYVVVDRVFSHLRDDDIVACGNASACILPFQAGPLRSGQRLFSNSGSASMGYDLPAAIGAATASTRRVICFAGDGSLQMNIQELQTLKTHGLNVIVIVLNNAGYLSIRQTHENFFGSVVGATPASGVDFPDFAAVARAYGIRATRIEADDGLGALEQHLDGDGPLLLDVIVDPKQDFAPRIKSRVGSDGKFLTPELDDMHPFLDRAEIDEVRASARAVRAIPPAARVAGS